MRGERCRHFCNRQRRIDQARCNRTLRHTVIFGFGGVLRDDETATGLDRFDAKSPVGPGS